MQIGSCRPGGLRIGCQRLAVLGQLEPAARGSPPRQSQAERPQPDATRPPEHYPADVGIPERRAARWPTGVTCSIPDLPQEDS